MIRILPCRAACSSVQDFNNFKISVPLWRAFVRLVLSLIPSLHVAGEDRESLVLIDRELRSKDSG